VVEEFWKMGCRKVTVFLPPNRQGNKGMPRIPEKERKLQKKMEDLDIIKVSQINEEGCVFLMIIWSECRLRQYKTMAK